MRQQRKLSGSIGAQFGGRKHPFVIGHLETSEVGSAPPCLPLPCTGQGHGLQEESSPRTPVLLHAWLMVGD